MGWRDKSDVRDWQLTDEERKALPEELRRFVGRTTSDTIAARTSACRKLAATARAEREALIEVRDLVKAHDELASLGEYKGIISRQAEEIAELRKALESERSLRRGATAERALAVHAEGSQR